MARGESLGPFSLRHECRNFQSNAVACPEAITNVAGQAPKHFFLQ